MPQEDSPSGFARLTPQERSILVTGVYLRSWRIEFCDGHDGEYGYIYRGGFDAPATWVVRKHGKELLALDQTGTEVARTPMASELICHLARTLSEVSALDALGIRRVAKLVLDCYGEEAVVRAAEYVENCLGAGDREGATAWREVAKVVEAMQREWPQGLIGDDLIALVDWH